MSVGAAEIERIFASCFVGTELRGGGDEPLYRPSSNGVEPHLIVYRHDYASSALHEVAHWCIAGRARREQVDYGYWYAADGRSPEQQVAFEQVEVKPQALEWIFADACGVRFELSADNLAGDAQPSEAFAKAVAAQKQRYLRDGLGGRAARFRAALADHGTALSPSVSK